IFLALRAAVGSGTGARGTGQLRQSPPVELAVGVARQSRHTQEAPRHELRGEPDLAMAMQLAFIERAGRDDCGSDFGDAHFVLDAERTDLLDAGKALHDLFDAFRTDLVAADVEHRGHPP